MLYNSINHVISAFSPKGWWGHDSREEAESAAGVGLCCTHNAAVRCLLGFIFCKVMQKQ